MKLASLRNTKMKMVKPHTESSMMHGLEMKMSFAHNQNMRKKVEMMVL